MMPLHQCRCWCMTGLLSSTSMALLIIIDHDPLMKALRHHCQCRVLLHERALAGRRRQETRYANRTKLNPYRGVRYWRKSISYYALSCGSGRKCQEFRSAVMRRGLLHCRSRRRVSECRAARLVRTTAEWVWRSTACQSFTQGQNGRVAYSWASTFSVSRFNLVDV